MTQHDHFIAVCRGEMPPNQPELQAGRAARDAGLPCGACPRPLYTVNSLSWRIGWHVRAIEIRADYEPAWPEWRESVAWR